jgi:hypothetical protein
VISLLITALVVLAPAQNHSGACTTAEPDGVTIVIDYQGLGGGIQSTCALGLPSGATGRTALGAIGASVQGTAHDGDSFVCRLNGRPSASEKLSLPSGDYQETCDKTPPSNAYWSYWYADDGGSWTYSTAGAGQHRVKAGGFEGWSFNLGGASAPAPRFAPAKVAAPTPPGAGGNGAGEGAGGGTGGGGGTGAGGSGNSGTAGASGGNGVGSNGVGGGSGGGVSTGGSSPSGAASGGASATGGVIATGPDGIAGPPASDDPLASPTGEEPAPAPTDAASDQAAVGPSAGYTDPAGTAAGPTGSWQAIAAGGVVAGSVVILTAAVLVLRRLRRPSQLGEEPPLDSDS